ncbi:MAG: hypothetical protein OFPI_26410 [Osedax symbiont Rs2]|nr:MAG: hypothetical protein OFPI_26410 [Osedax symbiont Rs2]
MSLNPDLQQMLEENSRAKGPALQNMPIEEARAALRDSFIKRGYPLEHPADIEHFEISTDSANFSIDIYRPINSRDTALPVLLYFHGGGFVLGDAQAYDRQSRALAYLLKVAVVFVNYRLAPEHRYPAATNDAREVVNWLAKHGKDNNLNVQKIIACGESAGGNLAVHAALHSSSVNTGKDNKLNIIATTLIYPVTDLRPFYQPNMHYPSMQSYANGYNLDIAELNWFWQQYLEREEQAELADNSLILHPQLQHLPNTQIFVAQCDPLRDLGIAFAMKLQELDVNTSIDCLPGMLHSFMFHGGVCGDALRHFYKVIEKIDAQFHSC